MRPVLPFVPTSGAQLPPGLPSLLAWTFPPGATALSLFAGTTDGDSDVLAQTSVPASSPPQVSLPVPLTANAIFVSAQLLAGAAAFAYSLYFTVGAGALPPDTVARRVITTYWLEAWLGPALDQPRYGAAGVPGQVGFDPESTNGQAGPYTVQQVRDAAGYTLLRFSELSRQRDNTLGGVELVGGVPVIVLGWEVLWNLEFDVHVPAKVRDAAGLAEARIGVLDDLFRGLTLLPGPPFISIRNLSGFPSRRRDGVEDGTWRRRLLDVKLLLRLRLPQSGAAPLDPGP